MKTETGHRCESQVNEQTEIFFLKLISIFHLTANGTTAEYKIK